MSIKVSIDSGERYRRHFVDYDNNFPQLQGLSVGDEYQSAIYRDDVIKTEVISDDNMPYLIPQIAPLDVYPWLNRDFYEKKYPMEMSEDILRHYTDIIDVEPSEDVCDFIGNLALKNGVLVFDYPSIDKNYPDRVITLVEDSGGSIKSIEELGTQTYYAGKVYKSHGFEKGVLVRSLIEVLKEMVVKNEIPNIIPSDGVTYVADLDESYSAHLFDIYSDAFQAINDHPCRQGYLPNEFYDAMVDPGLSSKIGKLILNSNDEVANMVMFSHDLPFPWLSQAAYTNLVNGNTKYLSNEVLSEFKNGKIIYFPAIATNPNNRRGLDSQPVIDLLAKAVHEANNEVITCFDCCDFNKDVLGLPTYIARLINNTEYARTDGFKEIGQQKYMSIKL